eukprot:gene23240-30464_t
MVGTNTGAWGPIRGPGLGLRAATKMMYTSQVDGGDQYGGLGTNKGAWPGFESCHQDDGYSGHLTKQYESRHQKIMETEATTKRYESRHQEIMETAATTKRYESRHQEIMETAATVFVDADEEYASLDAVKTALEELKFSYPKQYTSMYMHLSTPALFASYVRLELLHWDPLYADSASHGALETSREGVHKGFDQQAW